MYVVSSNTYLFVVLFSVVYLAFITVKTARQQLDLYDFLMLSMVAVVPAAFVLWPNIAGWVAEVAGVAFPFVVMFGSLFFILFLFMHRLTVKVHKLERDNRVLIQEAALLRQELDSKGKSTKE